MALLYATPTVDVEDRVVLDDIAGMRSDLASMLRAPTR